MRTWIENAAFDEGLAGLVRGFFEGSDELFQDFFRFDLRARIIAFFSRESGARARRSCALVEGAQFTFA